MAQIQEELVMQDQFSGPLDRYISKMEKAASSSSQTEGATVRMSQATQDLVTRLSGLENSIGTAYTDSEMERYLATLQKEMQKTGLVWTNSADQMESADLIARMGLQRLAEEGRITASDLAELTYAQASESEAERLAAKTAKEEAQAQRDAAKAAEEHRGRIRSLLTAILGLERGQRSIDGLSRQVRRFTRRMFSVRRILSALKSALERAPDSIQSSWEAAGNSIKNLFAGTVVSVVQGMQPALDRLNAVLNSDAGQKLSKGLQTLGNAAGRAIGFLLDKAAQLVEFLGNNFQTVMTAAAIIAGVFAAQMLLSAGAMVLANLPIILFIGLVAALVIGLTKAGVTSEQIFEHIGSAAGWLYALVYNLVADAWNVIATFAEFFANVFDDPVGAVARLFFGVFDSILGIVETVASAIDALLGTNMADAVSGFRSKMQSWVDDKFGESKIKIERMEKIDYADTMANFSGAAADLASSLSDFSLENMVGVTLKDISEDTGKIAKAVNMADEDLKNLVDMAERQYVNQINLTAQTPIVTVNGANTGNTQADRQAMADVIRDILIEQVAAGSTRSTARAYSGG